MTVLILRLSSLRDTAASSTHRLLADLVREAMPGANIDFAFLPPKRAPVVASHFTRRALGDFDLILVSNAYVQEAVNLPWLLHANGIAPWAPDRPEDFPPILLGGSNALAASCLARPDGVAVPDAFFFGEAEASLPSFIRRWPAGVGSKRERLLQAADGLDGFWITGALPAAPIRQAVARTPPPPAAILPLLDTESAGTVRLTVARGCAAFCSFCFEGYERKPYRELAVADLLDQARSLKRACGARTVELDAFNLNHFTGLGELVETCARLFDQVAFKSQRADGVAACPAIIDLERAAGKGTFTLGIEGISTRLRAFLAKSLTDAEITAAIKALLERRVREIKLFFILTAHETAEDLEAFGDFCTRLGSWLGRPAGGTRVVLSFGRLVRLPNTPLMQDRLFLEDEAWRFAMDGVAAACRRARLEFRFAFAYPDYLGTQLLAACGHEAAAAVVALACDGLSHHGPWRSEEAAQVRAAIRLSGVAPAFPFVIRPVSDAFLAERWQAAQQALDGGYCLGTACLGCGACADAAERGSITGRVRTPPVRDATIAAVTRLEAEKRRLAPAFLRASLPDDYAGHSTEWVSASLLRDLLMRAPSLMENLLAVDEAVFAFGDNPDRLPVPAGETVVMLKGWDAAALVQSLVSAAGAGLQLAPLPSGTFTPGAFALATWELHTSADPRTTAQQASLWLNELHQRHMLRRDGAHWRIDFAPVAARRGYVRELTVHPEAGGSCLTIGFTPKAPLRKLLSRLPTGPGTAVVRCTAIQY